MKIIKAKRLISWILACGLATLILIPFSSAISATGTEVNIGTPATLTAGSTFVVSVNIEGVTNLNGYQFNITYDNAVIHVASEEGGTGVTPGLIGSTTIPIDAWGFVPTGTPGKIVVLGHRPGTSGVTGQGYLIQIHFNTVGTAGQSSNLIISNLQLINNLGNPIPATTTGSSVTIENAGDSTRPSVISTDPANTATGVSIGTPITVVFSEAMSSSTINPVSFTLMHGITPVTGLVSCSGSTATFAPSANLALDTTYLATITNSVTDLAGNPMASNYTWSFTTDAPNTPTTTISVSPANRNVNRGDTFVANINIAAVASLSSFQFDLSFDSSVIQVETGGSGVTPGLIGSTVMPIDMFGFIPPETQGKLRVLGHRPGITGATGQGYLAQIHFNAVGSAGRNSNVTLSNVLLYDVQSNGISFSVTNGSVTITDTPLEITSSSLLEAEVGLAYSSTVNVNGGKSPYSWSASGLPASLTLSAAGVIAGNPATSGTFNVSVTVTDSSSPANSVTKTLALQVYPTLQITTSSLTTGSTAINFSTTLSGTGGKGSYSWSATGLPAGLALSSSGFVNGKPGVFGEFNVNITLTDSFNPVNSINKLLSLKVYLAGDANGDGQINMADVTKAERMILGLDALSIGADANGDGQVNMGDVTKIETIIMGL